MEKRKGTLTSELREQYRRYASAAIPHSSSSMAEKAKRVHTSSCKLFVSTDCWKCGTHSLYCNISIY